MSERCIDGAPHTTGCVICGESMENAQIVAVWRAERVVIDAAQAWREKHLRLERPRGMAMSDEEEELHQALAFLGQAEGRRR